MFFNSQFVFIQSDSMIIEVGFYWPVFIIRVVTTPAPPHKW